MNSDPFDPDAEGFFGLDDVIHFLAVRVNDGQLTIEQALEFAVRMLGDAEVHDGLMMWRVGLITLGFEEVAQHFAAVQLMVIAPTMGMRGVVLKFATEKDWAMEDATEEETLAFSKVTVALLRAGGIDATLEGHHVHINTVDESGEPKGDPFSVVIKQFAEEINEVLGEDPPEGWQRWTR